MRAWKWLTALAVVLGLGGSVYVRQDSEGEWFCGPDKNPVVTHFVRVESLVSDRAPERFMGIGGARPIRSRDQKAWSNQSRFPTFLVSLRESNRNGGHDGSLRKYDLTISFRILGDLLEYSINHRSDSDRVAKLFGRDFSYIHDNVICRRVANVSSGSRHRDFNDIVAAAPIDTFSALGDVGAKAQPSLMISFGEFFGEPIGNLSLLDGGSVGLKGPVDENYRTVADDRGGKGKERHNPLRKRILR